MVRINLDLLRKKAEHNEGCISTLKEVTLHQHEIEKIENLDKLCRRLQILYLQGNVIPKIENLARLRELNYLNLCLNNIRKIENLEHNEALEKLDMTCNFVRDPLCIESLRANKRLEELYLIGNPCTDDPDYRDFTIATLTQLKSLDGNEIERSERILATQRLPAIRARFVEEAAARPESESDSESEDDSDDEESEESEEEEDEGFQKRSLPDHVVGGKLDNFWTQEREKSYNGKFQFVRNADEAPTKGMVVAVQVDLKEFEPTIAAASCRTMSVIMEGPLVADCEKNMAGARFGCLLRCEMEQRAVPSLLGEWMGVFERVKKSWKLNSLKPLDQAKKEAENPEKYRGYRQPKVKKSEMTKNCPKDRLIIAREQAEEKAKKEGPNEKEEREKKKAAKLAAFEEERRKAAERCQNGDPIRDRPRQRNEGKWEFFLDCDQKDRVVLEVAVPKFLDTSAIDIDVQPTWVAVAIKGKEFLIHMPQECNADSAKAERSSGTGALVLTLPFVGEMLQAPELEDRPTNLNTVPKDKFKDTNTAPVENPSNDLSDGAFGTRATVNLNVLEANKEELEVLRKQRQDELAEAWAPRKNLRTKKTRQNATKTEVSPNFVDDPDVPPLE